MRGRRRSGGAAMTRSAILGGATRRRQVSYLAPRISGCSSPNQRGKKPMIPRDLEMAATGSFTEIPTIDLSQANEPSTLRHLLQQLRSALTEVGFLYVRNHGVPPRTIDDLVGVLPRLFALPEAAKRAIALENSPHFLGYSAVGTESTAGGLDEREQVEFATELADAWELGMPLYERLRGPNQWPDEELPELRPIVESYIREMTLLGERFLALVAQALSLPEGTFLPFLSDQHRLKLVRYPAAADAGAEAVAAPRQGVGPHKDSSGWWTFLLQASPPDVQGLQVLSRAGRWVDVPAVPGTFVVNIGQAFDVVTRGVCPATTHRVLLPPPSSPGTARDRLSVPFFQGVRRDLTRREALADHLGRHFEAFLSSTSSSSFIDGSAVSGSSRPAAEPREDREIDSPFLKWKYDTWGEAQLRTKIRSHRVNGRKFYGEVFERYINDTV